MDPQGSHRTKRMPMQYKINKNQMESNAIIKEIQLIQRNPQECKGIQRNQINTMDPKKSNEIQRNTISHKGI